jgi:DNA-binding transcriptional ArsR family regulator
MSVAQIDPNLCSILSTLHYLSSKNSKKYCYPSQLKLLTISEVVYSYRLSRATLNRKLRKLEDRGFIRRIRRLKRGRDNRIEFNTTLYILLRPAYVCLNRLVHSFHRARVYALCSLRSFLDRKRKTLIIERPSPPPDVPVAMPEEIRKFIRSL